MGHAGLYVCRSGVSGPVVCLFANISGDLVIRSFAKGNGVPNSKSWGGEVWWMLTGAEVLDGRLLRPKRKGRDPA